MLFLLLHSKHMYLVYWDDFVNRYIVYISYLLDLHRLQFVPLSFFLFFINSYFLAYETKWAIIPLGLAALDLFFTQPVDSLYVKKC